jgi:hypothetical protein
MVHGAISNNKNNKRKPLSLSIRNMAPLNYIYIGKRGKETELLRETLNP